MGEAMRHLSQAGSEHQSYNLNILRMARRVEGGLQHHALRPNGVVLASSVLVYHPQPVCHGSYLLPHPFRFAVSGGLDFAMGAPLSKVLPRSPSQSAQ